MSSKHRSCVQNTEGNETFIWYPTREIFRGKRKEKYDWQFDIIHNHWRREHVQKQRLLTLLQSGANVNEVDNDGQTMLIWAVQEQDMELVRILLHFKADVNCSIKHRQTTHGTMQKNNINAEIISHLVFQFEGCCHCTKGLPQAMQMNPTPWGFVNGTENTLQHRAVCDTSNLVIGNTALHTACFWMERNTSDRFGFYSVPKSSPKLVNLLLMVPHCNLDVRNTQGNSPLYWVLRGLMAYYDGRYPGSLFTGIASDFLDTVIYLVRAGASVLTTNPRSDSAVTLLLRAMLWRYTKDLENDQTILNHYNECLLVLLSAGSTLCKLDFEFMELLKPSLLEGMDTYARNKCSPLCSLRRLSKLAVRKYMHKRLSVNVTKPGLPPLLQDYVLLKIHDD